ncbi:ribosome biogenesis GTPase YlqF [Clostridium sp. 19966]|uniref:ribosome biogenesis GTPase YlqF n=1 Tax=Clostridium sp. 19966 TaxID=2768166 RepID=UPI0028DF8D0A|nr:ribosome biogenesis GTPase YlqF [Clostridium sp. 19966]MDT8716440.1 ribosome biogenesis GTPase YlqF [Clostridium sp. 19966]
MKINWFPGHMLKTKKEIIANLKLVDIVIEIRDSRIIRSSANPEIDKICAGKPRIILLNKSDLCEDRVVKDWCKSLTSQDVRAIPVNCISGKGLNDIKPVINEILKEKHERLKNKGIMNIVTRAMVVGIPNVGKSSFINKMAKNNIAKTGDRPGVTKNKQWIKTQLGLELLDTPGILWPKFEDDEVALNLAFTGAIKDEIMDVEELALELIKRLEKNYPKNLMERYKLNELSEDALENLDKIAFKRGAVISGGKIDYNRISNIILDEFRGGKIGRICLELP